MPNFFNHDLQFKFPVGLKEKRKRKKQRKRKEKLYLACIIPNIS